MTRRGLACSIAARSAATAVAVGMAVAVCVTACAHDVSQDAQTGIDGFSSGAHVLALVDGTASVTGTVTYPGGDRVDWYSVDLPRPGSLDLDLTWKSSRPDQRVRVDVLDDNNVVLIHGKRFAHAHREHARLELAQGRLYLRVFAPRRSDAGTYKLTVSFSPEHALAAPPDDVAFPPELPEVPEPPEPPEPTASTRRTPHVGSACPTPPDVDLPACWTVMPCPSPPDRRVKACVRWPTWDCSKPDPDMPSDACQGRPSQVIGRVIKQEPSGDGLIITVSRGSDQGVMKTWHGSLLRGDSDEPLVGGELVVLRVDKRVVVAKVHVTLDMLTANTRVRLKP